MLNTIDSKELSGILVDADRWDKIEKGLGYTFLYSYIKGMMKRLKEVENENVIG